jgi:hypothetical protein
MTIKNIALISPSNAPIPGALLEDGSICKITVTYDTTTELIDTLLDHDGALSFVQKNGEIICIDSENTEWPMSIVIDHSIFNELN